MGFLKKMMKGEGITANSDEDLGKQNGVSKLEEQYMKLYMKAGRDFVHKEDFERIIQELLDYLDIEDFEISLDRSDSSARQRAEEYKHFLETSQSGTDHYPDLLKLDED